MSLIRRVIEGCLLCCNHIMNDTPSHPSEDVLDDEEQIEVPSSITFTIEGDDEVGVHVYWPTPESDEDGAKTAMVMSQVINLMNKGAFLPALQRAIGYWGTVNENKAVATTILQRLHQFGQQDVAQEYEPVIPPRMALNPNFYQDNQS